MTSVGGLRDAGRISEDRICNLVADARIVITLCEIILGAVICNDLS